MFKIITLFLLSITVIFNSANAQQPQVAQNDTQLGTISADKIDPSRFYINANVQILNKTTAKTSNMQIQVNKPVDFGTLKIIIHKCWQASLDQKPESKMLLEVFENEQGKTKQKRIFYGWIFSSSPSISGLEHPIYDISAINCK